MSVWLEQRTEDLRVIYWPSSDPKILVSIRELHYISVTLAAYNSTDLYDLQTEVAFAFTYLHFARKLHFVTLL